LPVTLTVGFEMNAPRISSEEISGACFQKPLFPSSTAPCGWPGQPTAAIDVAEKALFFQE
jgi:hypothetical protein